MPDLNRNNVATWKLRLRRKFATDTAGLATLSDSIAAEAAEFVTFTSTSEDGSSAAGVITGNKMEILTAIEELLGDQLFMAGVTQPASRMSIPDFSQCSPT